MSEQLPPGGGPGSLGFSGPENHPWLPGSQPAPVGTLYTRYVPAPNDAQAGVLGNFPSAECAQCPTRQREATQLHNKVKALQQEVARLRIELAQGWVLFPWDDWGDYLHQVRN